MGQVVECKGIFSSLSPTVIIVASMLYVISAVIAALGKTFCLIVLWQPSQRSKSNKILTSLALSDCLVGYVCFPLAIWLINDDSGISETRCWIERIYGPFTLWMAGCSTCSILFVAFERYLLIARSHGQYNKLTDRKVTLIIVFYWTLCFAVSFLCVMDIAVYTFVRLFNFLWNVIFLCVSYYYIWKAVRQSHRRIASNVGGSQQVGL